VNQPPPLEPAQTVHGWTILASFILINLLALAFFFSPGTGDVSIWNNWMRQISEDGLIAGYRHSDTDYPPLTFVLLAAVSRSAMTFGVPQLIVLKLSLFLFLLATSACFYFFTRNALLTAGLELGLIVSSMGLAYLDIYFAPFLIAGFFLLQRGNLTLGFLLFTISCCIKWQPLIIAPFVCVYVFTGGNEQTPEKSDHLKRRLIPFALAVAIAIALLLIFGAKIFDSLQRAMTRHLFLSAYALNLSWLQTWALHLISPEKYGPLQNGEIDIFLTRDPLIVWPDKILLYLSYATILIGFARQTKTFERLVVYSMLGYLAYFCFNTGVHENHLFLVCCLAWVLVFLSPSQVVRGINLTLAANANLFLFYGVFGERLVRVFGGVDITLFFALANLALFLGFLVEAIRRDGLDVWLVKLQPRAKPTT
jgi:hypothetical protein